jgi:hypothetical protein
MFDSDSPFPQAISAFADCSKPATANFQVAGTIHQLPCRDFPRGRRDTQLPCCDFPRGRRNTQLPRRNFSLGRRDPSIAAP